MCLALKKKNEIIILMIFYRCPLLVERNKFRDSVGVYKGRDRSITQRNKNFRN